MEGAAPKPFKVEYSKSGRASCKKCRSLISKDVLRIATVTQSTLFDGYMTNWFHPSCMLKKSGSIKSIGDIEGLDSLRWEDQQKIRKYIQGEAQAFEDDGDGGGGGGAEDDEGGEFVVEYAKSNRSTCRGCDTKINKDEVRIARMLPGPQGRPTPAWRHASCMLKMGWWTEPLEKLPGWNTLNADDHTRLLGEAGAIGGGKKRKGEAGSGDGGPPPKKGQKTEEAKPAGGGKAKGKGQAKGGVCVEESLAKALERQSRDIWALKDSLHNSVNLQELRELLEENGQDSKGAEGELRDRCADGILFGPLGACPVCQGKLEYRDGMYRCRGFVSEWSKCVFTTGDAIREGGFWKVPEDTENEYLQELRKGLVAKGKKKGVLPVRLQPPAVVPSAPTPKLQAAPAAKPLPPEGVVSDAPLKGMTVVFLGRLSKTQNEWKDRIEDAGGKLVAAVSTNTNCVISAEESLEPGGGNAKVKKARELSIPILREAYLEDCLDQNMRLPMGGKYLLEAGGGAGGSAKVKVKGRGAVHADSGLQDTGHVLDTGGSVYNATLNLADLASGANSYYVLQVIEEDQGGVCHLYRKWGRVGNAAIGRDMLSRMPRQEAMAEFKRLFGEKTGNPWEAWEGKEGFRKRPGKFFPLDMDYGLEEGGSVSQPLAQGPRGGSKLGGRVQDLLRMLFDVEQFKAAMLEFEINVNEMPLGKLSKGAILKGYGVLTEIQNLLQSEGGSKGVRAARIMEASSRFFTLIPTVAPTAINDTDRLKQKIHMLESLRDIEIASTIMKGEGKEDEDPLETHYHRLQCQLAPLPKDSAEFGMIESYLLKTHAPTHKEWDLEVEDVFSVDRGGEGEADTRIGNRMLLWHGSRTTNYAGILSQGLRIAPPEAPVTGYMFGKGVYFADLVSKSAQYCYPTKAAPSGLMLLSEVALGEVYPLRKAQFLEKLPQGKQSTKGLGKVEPDAKEHVKWRGEVTVPIGKPVPSGVRASELQYNEYIVYDTKQIKLRFLLKVKFKHKI